MKKKWIILILLLLVIPLLIVGGILLTGGVLGGLFLFSGSGDSGDDALCEAPYIQVGSSCCLDENGNDICDTDDLPATTIKKSTTTRKTATTTLKPIVTTSPPPTIPQASSATCSKDSDCGTKQYRCFGGFFCSEGDVYRNCRIDLCENPGLPTATCTIGTKDVLIDDCTAAETCEDGKAMCTPSIGSCIYNPVPIPQSAERINITADYGDKIVGYQFKMRSKTLDKNGCIDKIYLYMKKPVGLEATKTVNWDAPTVFEDESVRAGLIKSVSDDIVNIWVELPCTSRGKPFSGATTLTVNTKTFSGWGSYQFKLKKVLYDSGGQCPERIQLEVIHPDEDKSTVYPTWKFAPQLDGQVNVGLLGVFDNSVATIWIK